MSSKDKREFRRVTTLMPFEVRRIDPREYASYRCRVSRDTIVVDESTPPRVNDDALNHWLNMLNTKLDYLISLSSPKQYGSSFMAVEPLNISGSGMSIITKEAFNIDDILEIKVVIQIYPAKVLYLYGKIIRFEQTPHLSNTRTLGIAFLNMNEEVRNEILKFDFKKHKEKLIEKKIF
ncbi:MAG: hypothetical protein CVU54_08470 [Deltaproteobacteria bacterium HGW-Deltaproteobacteria-12]|jgi:hypothetical protein|nr:MAG: hypothetical protein CVU54_08470 [Deltaproteobacteria bacterium HGW-Deltaproteobacteria-12]